MNHWNLCVVNAGVPVAIEFCATQDNTHVWGLLAAVKWSEVWCLSVNDNRWAVELTRGCWGARGGGSAVGLQRSRGFSGIRRAEQVLWWCSCQVWGEEQLADCSSRSAGQRMWRWSPPRVTLIVSGLTRSLIQQQGHIFRRERSCGYTLMKRMTKKQEAPTFSLNSKMSFCEPLRQMSQSA